MVSILRLQPIFFLTFDPNKPFQRDIQGKIPSFIPPPVTFILHATGLPKPSRDRELYRAQNLTGRGCRVFFFFVGMIREPQP